MFRPAVITDASFILGLLREFYDKAGHIYGIPFDDKSTLKLIHAVIADGICLVGSSSCAGASFYPFTFNERAIIAHVRFWFFKNCGEIRILDELKARCREAGATHMAASSHAPNHTIGRWYVKHLSFTPCETEYLTSL